MLWWMQRVYLSPGKALRRFCGERHAAEYFRRQGFRNLYNLSGGIDAGSAFVDPSVRRY